MLKVVGESALPLLVVEEEAGGPLGVEYLLLLILEKVVHFLLFVSILILENIHLPSRLFFLYSVCKSALSL